MKRTGLLPERFKSPLFLFLISAVPLLVLLCINMGSYFYLSSEIDPSFDLQIGIIGSLFLLTLLVPVIIGSLYHIKKKGVPWFLYWFTLALPSAYLFVFVYYFNRIFPASMDWWIVSPLRMIYFQFLFVIPLIFYSLIQLASIRLPLSPRKDILGSTGITIAIPLSWYILFQTTRFFSKITSDISYLIVTLMMIASTIILFLLIIRLILYVTQWLSQKGPVIKSVFIVLISLVLPLGGLLLNRTIPFPADLQITAVYIMAVLNGMVVSTPDTPFFPVNKAVRLLRIVMYPFTLYFFILFLPFLPLSIPAIIFFGAGFLILTPTMLFLVHTKQIAEDFSSQKLMGRKLALSIVLFLIIPATFVGGAIYDKIQLNRAIAYVYHPDYTEDTFFKGNRFFLKRGLNGMQSMKEGKFLPLISGFYNYVVYENLILPDSKYNHIYKTFFGELPESSGSRHSQFFEIFSAPVQNPAANIRVPPFSESESVLLDSITEVSTTTERGVTHKRLRLSMKAEEYSFNDEFRTRITIPPHVLVSKFSLDIEGRKIDGKLFEKKTAMWVYRMITNSLRDPAMLYYHAKNELRLQVFPFGSNETRYCDIEFSYPENGSASISFGERKYTLNESNNTSLFNTKLGDSSCHAFIVPVEAKQGLKRITRKPKPYIILDWSKDGIDSIYTDQINSLLPEKDITVFLVNYNTIKLENIESLSDLKKLNIPELKKKYPQQGGFALDRGVKHILLSHDSPYDGTVPLTVPLVIIQHTGKAIEDLDLSSFQELTPDARFYMVGKHSHDKFTFNGSYTTEDILYHGSLGEKSINGFITADNGKSDIQYLLSSEAEHLARSVPKLYSSTYASGLSSVKMYMDTKYYPFKTQELYKKSVLTGKESGVLSPSTTYIVVERESQWKALDTKEKEKLNKNPALEYSKSPEPELFVLLMVIIIIVGTHKYRNLE